MGQYSQELLGSVSVRSLNRRDFLRATSAGITALAGSQFFLTDWARSQSPEALAKGPSFDKGQLRALAQKALEAARASGAKFADVRILIATSLSVNVSDSGALAPYLWNRAEIGVRAVVDSTFGFAGDVLELDADKVALLAQTAVARSRAGHARKARSFEFVPAPVVINGSWQTPIEIDPFTVPVGEQEALLLDGLDAVKIVKASEPVLASCGVAWMRHEDIFASTEGSTIEQRTYTAMASAVAAARSAHDKSLLLVRQVGSLRSGGYGYEALRQANLKTEWRRAAEEAVRLSAQRTKSVEVGRYDLVLSAAATANLLVATIGHPLELDRALMLSTNDKGTTYAMPPDKVLGKLQVGSPLVNVTANRSQPGAGATVGWDSEGVKPDNFTLLREGILVDYVTTRETAPALRGWYEAHGQQTRSHGCTIGSGADQPALHLPNLTLNHGATQISVDELIKDVKKGFFIDNTAPPSVDQTGSNTQIPVQVAEEIVNGQRTGLSTNMAISFTTPQFWRGADAIGGSESIMTQNLEIQDPQIYNDLGLIGVTTVPMRVRKVNVTNTGKKS